MTVADIARVAHEANRAYCVTLGDLSQLPWDAAPQWQRDSCLSGVRFKIANPDSTPEQSHENWLLDKEKDGWSYGERKDVEKKLHPCFRAYDDLPIEQRRKDAIFQSIVTACLNGAVIADA